MIVCLSSLIGLLALLMLLLLSRGLSASVPAVWPCMSISRSLLRIVPSRWHPARSSTTGNSKSVERRRMRVASR